MDELALADYLLKKNRERQKEIGEVLITGGAGLLGVKHAESIAEFGGSPILLDINADAGNMESNRIFSHLKAFADDLTLIGLHEVCVKTMLPKGEMNFKKIMWIM